MHWPHFSLAIGQDLIIQEAKTMRRLNHQNVLHLLAAFVSDSALWMVMPYISGGPLSAILQRRFPRGMDETTLSTVARDVLRGLEYLHKNDCMHRDLKVRYNLHIAWDPVSSLFYSSLGF
jgi:serine/threonine-protein kinase OSR1/STK39